MKNHRLLAGGALTTALTLALTGCAFSDGGDDTGSTSGASATGKVTLTFQSLAYQDATVAATKEIVDSWNQANPDIQIKLVQGSWDNVHDQLVTQFQGGTAPDIIQDDSSDIRSFANEGYLADLSSHLSPDVKSAVSKDIWDTVTIADGKVVAAPTLLQTYVVFANTDALKSAGVSVPDGKELSWSDFESIAKKATKDGSYGAGWGLKSPTAAMMSTALNFGGTFFDTSSDGSATISVGDHELAVPEAVHDMAYTDKSLSPVTLTQSGSDVLPGFLGGKYAMLVGGNYLAQQLTETAPKSFHWTVLPALAGSAGTAQAADPQTMSVSARSTSVPQAAQFIDYFMKPENQAKLAEGDWLIPASSTARDLVEKQTAGKNGWAGMLASAENLQAAPYQAADDFAQWSDQYATPQLQKYFANSISTDELKKQLTSGWDSVSG